MSDPHAAIDRDFAAHLQRVRALEHVAVRAPLAADRVAERLGDAFTRPRERALERPVERQDPPPWTWS